MTPNRNLKTNFKLPEWLHEALREREPTDDLPNKRAESRRVWTVFCLAQPEDEPSMDPFTARVFNACAGGVGFIARKEVPVGQRLELRPEHGPEETSVHVRVIHCTRTVQGYKVGCAFVPP